MFAETTSWGNYFYGGLRNFIDAEAAYVNTRQQSAKANLPKVALSVADSVSFAVKGITAATILGYGAPLPITALATLSLFPSNTFSYLATQINKFSNKIDKWLSSDDEQTDEQSSEDKQSLGSTAASSNRLGSISNWVPTLETVQYITTNGLTLYQNLLPINWLKIMTVEAVEQPLRWYYGGALPEYYTNNAIGDWVWMLSGVTGEMIQSHRLLRNTCYSKQLSLANVIPCPVSSINSLSTISWANSRDVIKGANLGGYLFTNNMQHIVPILPLLITQLLGKSIFKENFNIVSTNFIVLAGLSLLQTIDAGSTTINLQAGIPINTTIDLTQLAGTSNIAGLIIKYPPQLAQSGLKIYPKLIGNYTQGQQLSDYQLLATSKNQVELLSLGIQLLGETLKTTFFSEGQIKWKYLTGGGLISSPTIALDGTVYLGSQDYYLYAVNPDGNLKWKYLTGGGINSAPTIAADGTVYTGSYDNYLYAVNPDGSLKWKYLTGGMIDASSPTVAGDGTVYIESRDNYLYAIYPNGNLKWKCSTGGWAVTTSSLAVDGTIYVGSSDGYLYAIYPNNGSVKWKYFGVIDTYSSSAIGKDGIIYIGSNDGYVHAIYPSDGSLKWKYLTGSAVQSSPAIGVDGIIYIGSLDDYLYAFYPNGSVKWKYFTDNSQVRSSPAIGEDGTIYVGTSRTNFFGDYTDYFKTDPHYMYAMNPDGSLKWKYLINGWVESSPTIAPDGTVYVGSFNNYIYALSTKVFSNTSPWPQFHQNNLHTGIQPIPPQLQIFDMRYLTIEGTPNITGTLNIEVTNDQITSFYMNMNFNAVSPLYSACNVINPIPDQTVDINSQYNFKIDAKQIFSGDIQYITVTETGKTSLPNWMTLNRTITDMVMQDIEGEIEASEDILYVSSGVGMQLINISDIDHPRLTGEVVVLESSSYWGWSILLENKTAYLVQYAPYWSNTFNIIDVSNANNPTVLSSRYLGFVDLACIDVFNGVAYLGLTWTMDGNAARVVDVKDSTNPISLNGISQQVAGSGGSKIQVKNGIAYITNCPLGPWTEHVGLALINVSDQNNFVFLGRIDWYSYFGGIRITVLDHIAYTTSDEQLLLINVSNPYDPTILSSFTIDGAGYSNPSCTSDPTNCTYLSGFRIIGNLAYISSCKQWKQPQDRAMHIVDISDPKNLRSLEVITLPHGDLTLGGGGCFAINNGIGAISTKKTNLHIFSLNKLQLIGNPFINDIGSHSLTVTAFDYNGNNCSTTFKVTVSQQNLVYQKSPTVTETLSTTNTQTITQTNTYTTSPSPTNTDTPTSTNTVTNTNSPTTTDSVTFTVSPSPTSTHSPTLTNTASPTPTDTDSITSTNTDSVTPTSTHSATLTTSLTPTDTHSPTLTSTASPTPSNTDSITSTNTDSTTPTDTHSPTLTNTDTNSVTSTSTAVCSPTLKQLCCVNSNIQIHNKKFNTLALDSSTSIEQEHSKLSGSTSYCNDKANFIAGGLAGITLGAGATLLFSYLYRKKQQNTLAARLNTENTEHSVSSTEKNIHKDANSLRRKSSCC